MQEGISFQKLAESPLDIQLQEISNMFFGGVQLYTTDVKLVYANREMGPSINELEISIGRHDERLKYLSGITPTNGAEYIGIRYNPDFVTNHQGREVPVIRIVDSGQMIDVVLDDPTLETFFQVQYAIKQSEFLEDEEKKATKPYPVLEFDDWID